jgi:hypothetical protein
VETVQKGNVVALTRMPGDGPHRPHVRSSAVITASHLSWFDTKQSEFRDWEAGAGCGVLKCVGIGVQLAAIANQLGVARRAGLEIDHAKRAIAEAD